MREMKSMVCSERRKSTEEEPVVVNLGDLAHNSIFLPSIFCQ